MDLGQLREEGVKLGLEGQELVKFVQGEREREERTKEREREDRAKERALRKEELQLQIELEKTRNSSLIQNSTHELEQSRGFSHPSLPKFDPRVDKMDSFIERFERFAVSTDYPRDQWCLGLSVLLTGKALEVYSSLPLSFAQDYEELKKELLKSFDLNAVGYRKQFKEAVPFDMETGPQFVARLKSMFVRWLNLSGVGETYSELVDFILKDRFLSGVNDELRVFLSERDLESKTVDELGKLADTFISAHSCSLKTNTSKTKHSVHVNKSEKSAAPLDANVAIVNHANSAAGLVTCYKCKQKGHLSKDCPCSTRARRCFVCSELGHVAKYCKKNTPVKREVSAFCRTVNESTLSEFQSKVPKVREFDNRSMRFPAGSVVSLTCRSEEVERELPSNLPISVGTVNQKRVRVMRDSGCTSIIVRTSLVRDEQFVQESAVCAFVDGSTHRFRVAVVDVDTEYYQGTVKAICMENPICDLIVGNVAGAKDPVLNQCSTSKTDIEMCDVAVTRNRAKKLEEGPKQLEISLPAGRDISVTELSKWQIEDKSLKSLWGLVDKGRVKGYGNVEIQLVIEKEVLYRKVWGYKKRVGTAVKQVVVPKELRNEVLTQAHDSIMAGHLGTQKTLDRILLSFYWPGVGADVKRFCRSCDICQRVVHKGKVVKVPLERTPVIETPFDRVSIDLIGPMSPASERGNRYVLVVVDHASRYPEAIPLRFIDTVTIAEALLEIFSRVGFPREILSDRGTQFTAELMREITRLVNIKQLFTTPYNPKCNGMVERMNGTLKSMLRKMCIEEPRNWDRYIPALLFAYREVPQASTGFSPFELLYGRTLRGPMQVLKQLWTEEEGSDVRTTYQYVFDLRNRLEETCSLARETVKKSQENYKHFYDKKARPRWFRVGQKVLLLLPLKHNKLELQWQGPFIVLKRMGNCDYQIKKGSKKKVFHINLLKEYVERAGSTPVDNAAQDLIGNEEVTDPVLASVLEHSDATSLGEELLELRPGPQPMGNEIKVSNDLSIDQIQSVNALVADYDDVFSTVPGTTHLITHEIVTETTSAVKGNTFSIPYHMREKVDKEIQEMLQLGIIEPSNSPYNAGVVIVKKGDGSIRVCTDFRKLNAVTKFDSEPMSDIEDILSKLSRARYFTQLDFTKGFWQIPVGAGSREKTAFSVPSGHFQYAKMPMGLVNSPATFNKLMRKLIHGLDNVVHFVDDVLVFSVSWEEHLANIRSLLNRVRESGLKLKPSKCCVGFSIVRYLGYTVGQGELQTDPEKVDKIRKASVPKSKKQVRAFLGLLGYYRKFIPGFSDMALPLTELTKKRSPEKIVWKEIHQHSFDALKDCLCTKPILQLPDLSKPFVLRTDASDTGLGAVLLQDHDGMLCPVSYASKKLLDRECKYSTVEKEGLAIVFGMQKFKNYLYGKEFVLETDHRPLSFIQTMKHTNTRVLRWSLFLQNYRYNIAHIKGSNNVVADFLSRSTES